MKLKEIRKNKKLTQEELSILSEINIRTIQNFEQGQKDINKAQAITIYKLSKALECEMKDILNI